MNKPYEIINVTQGTPEWIALRRKYITASQVASLMGLSPYETYQDVLNDKLHGIQKDTTGKEYIFAKGHFYEKQLRSHFNLQGYNFLPTVVVSKEIPELLASLDGLDIQEDHDINFEVKYVGKDKFLEINAGQIPKHHLIQVHAQLLATGARHCVYAATNGVDSTSRIIENDKRVQDTIREVIKEFAARISGNISRQSNVITLPQKYLPEVKPVEQKWVTIEDQRLHELYLLKLEIDRLKEQYEYIKKDVTSHYSQFQKFKGGGIRIEKSSRKGSIQYSEIPELKLVNLEKYRGPNIEVVTLSIDEEFNDNEI